MSMVYQMLGVTPAQIALLRAEPGLTKPVSDAALYSANAEPDAASLPPHFGPLGEALDIQTSWHIFHFLFTQQTGPDGSARGALLGGEPVGGDLGYGPAGLLSVEQTRDFAAYLATQDASSLAQRMNMPAMRAAGVYGLPGNKNILNATAEEWLRATIVDGFTPLKNFVLRMAAGGNGLLLWII